MHLYVYYTVALEHVAETHARVVAMQADLGLEAHEMHLLKRDDRGDETETWMEIYDDVSIDFEARLTVIVERHGLATLQGPRHVERFTEFA
jgi:hypothetical protein